jgi:hypothetical protein
VDYLESSGTTAFLVIHDDRLLYERYFNGYDETSLNTSFSTHTMRGYWRGLQTTPLFV